MNVAIEAIHDALREDIAKLEELHRFRADVLVRQPDPGNAVNDVLLRALGRALMLMRSHERELFGDRSPKNGEQHVEQGDQQEHRK